MDIKKLIVDCFDDQIKSNFNLSAENISVPPNNTMGDFCMPCFTWVKSLKKSPVEVAKDLTQNFNYNGVVEKTEVVGGYLNFFLNKKVVSLNVLAEILASKENFGRSDEGLNKKYKSLLLILFLPIILHFLNFLCDSFGTCSFFSADFIR